ncbi:hypothetical protein EPUS_03157 [Endocarpon pusillum Z07020]|uniref:FHA domain-containing protein n=1 Tax=Endocarpon pusillum (strain Z07020 / HMAS-L-300199) TaxID=1263415 RepID=U1HVD9_ENDPU|nr:uncharacterized protein EPUS_03157 [Endocarpon pusillum Z07020]ERF73324.1 hypothetical protein EPUS_03157 [Endocarpon pusillum Z07020]
MAQPRRNLSVELQILNSEDPHPTRNFILRSPTYAIRIGRGSKSGNRELFPASYNAWFDSRVMSREHAVLKADPDDRCVYIEDVGSMHGTYVEDQRVVARERHRLYDEDLVKFGNVVTRGPESFPPLHVVVRYSWVAERYISPMIVAGLWLTPFYSFGQPQAAPGTSQVELPPNTFHVPDYDDEEDGEDADISFVQETVLKPKLEVVVPTQIIDLADSPIDHSCIEEAMSKDTGRLTAYSPTSPLPPLPSSASSPLPRSMDGKAYPSSPALQMSPAAAGPSGLSEAERQADKWAINLNKHNTSSFGSSMSSDQQSPTNNSSPPTSSLSKESNHYPNAKPSGYGSSHVASQPTDLDKGTTLVDEDLTQSESDSDDPNSPALMVDDSEDEQGHDAVTDYGSDSDEEALLIAEDHGTKTTRAEEDSTDSESSRSDFSDDIGMERDEDIFDHFPNKTFGTKESMPKDTCGDYETTTTQPEAIPYNMRPGNFTMHATRLSLPANTLNRAPSPSDAAMAKPCEFPTHNSGVPGGQYPYTNSQQWSTPMASAYSSAWPCTFDGRSHAPYDERFGEFPYSYGASCAPGQVPSDPLRAYQSQMSMLDAQSFPGTKQINRPSCTLPQPPWQPPPIFKPNSSMNALTAVAIVPENASKPTAKVSIDSIVERVADEPMPSQNDNKLKRKADDMTSSSVPESTSTTQNHVAQIEAAEPPACRSQSKIASMTQVKALQAVPSVTGNEEERPAKRARTGNETGRTSFATLAATALAGAVVGGVGVVAALVSLPQDFFV